MTLVTEEGRPAGNGPPATSVGGGHLGSYLRYTVGRVIPKQVARPQSLPLFHPATASYRNDRADARASKIGQRSSNGPGREAGQNSSEESPFFGLDNGVHYRMLA